MRLVPVFVLMPLIFAQTLLAQELANDQPLFDLQASAPSAKKGEYVLCPSRPFFDEAVKKGADKSTFIYYAAKMVESKNGMTTVTNLAGRTFSLPNQMIISIPPGQTTKVGEVVLTWWQSGSGMQRAIVVGGTKTEPVVRYLDVTLDNPSGVGKKEDTLKPDSFVVLNDEFQVGTTIAADNGRQQRYGRIVAVTDDHVLASEFAGRLACYERSAVKPLPVIPELQVGDIALAALYGSFKPVTVERVDTKIGRVFVTFELGRQKQEKVFAFGEIYKKRD